MTVTAHLAPKTGDKPLYEAVLPFVSLLYTAEDIIIIILLYHTFRIIATVFSQDFAYAGAGTEKVSPLAFDGGRYSLYINVSISFSSVPFRDPSYCASLCT